MRFTLPTSHKLKSKKSIDQLFASGKSIRKGAVRVVFSICESHATENKVGFSVSKRFFKKAVDRNRVKRVMRESYRLNQHILELPKGTYVNIMFIYQSNKLPDYHVLIEIVPKLLKELNKISTS